MITAFALKGASEFDRWLAALPRQTIRAICGAIIPAALGPMRTEEIQRAASEIGGRLGTQIAGSVEISRVRVSRRYGGFYAVTRLVPRDYFVTWTRGAAMAPMSVQRRGRTRTVARLVQGQRYYLPAAVEFGHAFPGRGGRLGAPKDVAAIPALSRGAAAAAPAVVARLEQEFRTRLESERATP